MYSSQYVLNKGIGSIEHVRDRPSVTRGYQIPRVYGSQTPPYVPTWLCHYGEVIPKPETLPERQGYLGVCQLRSYLKHEGYGQILFNQDRDNFEKRFPDVAAFNPDTGEWELWESKNWIKTDEVHSADVEIQFLGKVQPIAMTAVFIHKRVILPKAQVLLDLAGIKLVNGLPEAEGVFHSSKGYSLIDSTVGPDLTKNLDNPQVDEAITSSSGW